MDKKEENKLVENIENEQEDLKETNTEDVRNDEGTFEEINEETIKKDKQFEKFNDLIEGEGNRFVIYTRKNTPVLKGFSPITKQKLTEKVLNLDGKSKIKIYDIEDRKDYWFYYDINEILDCFEDETFENVDDEIFEFEDENSDEIKEQAENIDKQAIINELMNEYQDVMNENKLPERNERDDIKHLLENINNRLDNLERNRYSGNNYLPVNQQPYNNINEQVNGIEKLTAVLSNMMKLTGNGKQNNVNEDKSRLMFKMFMRGMKFAEKYVSNSGDGSNTVLDLIKATIPVLPDIVDKAANIKGKNNNNSAVNVEKNNIDDEIVRRKKQVVSGLKKEMIRDLRNKKFNVNSWKKKLKLAIPNIKEALINHNEDVLQFFDDLKTYNQKDITILEKAIVNE